MNMYEYEYEYNKIKPPTKQKTTTYDNIYTT